MKDSSLGRPLLGGCGLRMFTGTESVQRRLVYAIIFCLVFTLIEVVVGILSNSLALISDASHLISDICSYLISLFGIHLSKRKATKTMSFGYNRAEILGALLSILLIWIMTAMLVYEAIQRMFYPVNVDGFSMFVTAIFGTLSNLFISFVLSVHNHGMGSVGATCGHHHAHHQHGHHHRHSAVHGRDGHSSRDPSLDCSEQADEPCSTKALLENQHKCQVTIPDLTHETDGCVDVMQPPTPRRPDSYVGLHEHSHHARKHSSEQESLALRSAYIHVIGDVLQNVGVMVAGLLIWYRPTWTIADPLCTIVFSFFVLATTLKILKDSTNVLMEGTPIGIDCVSIQNDFLRLSSVLEVHDLHVWSLSVGVPALSCHIVVASEESARVTLKYATDLCQNKYGIFHTTIQIDYSSNKVTCETIHHQKCLMGSSHGKRSGDQETVLKVGYSA
ncbi:cation diffusion facilitator-like membrane [Cryptosporidium canis]|uniref:Cation diffusion facilitator-like membrane n=1 Tax=Cryptosporidium canis TaxID=195482 RepID=A0ABQ8P342_9CRYT|nr:cation diffusion facilitator-like membrane [Cryptosporidium canis]